MSKETAKGNIDDFEAVRRVVGTLDKFDATTQERILRWARERLGLPTSGAEPPAHPGQPLPSAPPVAGVTPSAPADIGSFMLAKNPESDRQAAAVVAYWYRMVATGSERRDTITQAELVDAFRKAHRTIPAAPNQTLINAFHAGYLDKGGEPGTYRLNSVGENLVTHALPGGDLSSIRPSGKGGRRKRAKGRSSSARPRRASKRASGARGHSKRRRT